MAIEITNIENLEIGMKVVEKTTGKIYTVIGKFTDGVVLEVEPIRTAHIDDIKDQFNIVEF